RPRRLPWQRGAGIRPARTARRRPRRCPALAGRLIRLQRGAGLRWFRRLPEAAPRAHRAAGARRAGTGPWARARAQRRWRAAPAGRPGLGARGPPPARAPRPFASLDWSDTMIQHWTFGQRIGAGVAVKVALTIVIAVIAVYALRSVVQAKDDVISVNGENLLDAQKLQTAAARRVVGIRGFLLERTDAHLDVVRTFGDEFRSTLGRLRARATAEDER